MADLAAARTAPATGDGQRPGATPGFAFDYDADTARELDAAASAPRHAGGRGA